MTTLILVPTQLELSKLLDDPAWREDSPIHLARHGEQWWAVCGIGPAAAAFTTGQLLRDLTVERVILVGIAGAYRESRFLPGDVVQARSECFADLGYRDDGGFHSLDEINLPILPGTHKQLGCRYPLPVLANGSPSGHFVTMATVTTESTTASLIHRQFDAVAENMEGAGAAMACAWADVPFYQVRGISNLVGPRNPKEWLIDEALANLRAWLAPHLA